MIINQKNIQKMKRLKKLSIGQKEHLKVNYLNLKHKLLKKII